MILREDKLKEIILKYEIPFNMIQSVKDIFNFCHYIDEKKFDEIIKYLKQRAVNDCYNFPPTDERFKKENCYDWTFYLEEYSYYIRYVLRGKGMSWMDGRKRLFPNDVFDVTYKHRSYRNKYFWEYMKEKYPDSMKQIK